MNIQLPAARESPSRVTTTPSKVTTMHMIPQPIHSEENAHSDMFITYQSHETYKYLSYDCFVLNILLKPCYRAGCYT